jgi:hypothetical protein
MLKAKAVAPVLVEFFGTRTTAGAAPNVDQGSVATAC